MSPLVYLLFALLYGTLFILGWNEDSPELFNQEDGE